MPIILKRVYEPPSAEDGYRVLVDRLWPRGLSKDRAKVDEWVKETAPSTELRVWFHQDRTQWAEFKRRYLAELKTHRAELLALAERARTEQVTLLFSATDLERNHAVVILDYLKKLSA